MIVFPEPIYRGPEMVTYFRGPHLEVICLFRGLILTEDIKNIISDLCSLHCCPITSVLMYKCNIKVCFVLHYILF